MVFDRPVNVTRDAAFALALFAFAAACAVAFIRLSHVVPQFYQNLFFPAVSMACGQGYQDLAPGSAGRIGDFLGSKADSIACEEIPRAGADPNGFQRAHLYLIGAVGLLWSIVGISWSGLLPLYALLHGTAVVASYAILRLCAGRVLSLVGAIALAASALQLNNLPHIRDYAKAPFILLTVLAMGLMTRIAPRVGPLVALSAAAGIVVGLGTGFRMDILVFVPAVIVSLMVLPGDGVAHHLRAKASAIAAFVVTFFALAWPVLSGLGGNNNIFHVIALGLMEPFDEGLGIVGSIYEWGYAYNDVYANNVIASFGQRTLGATQEMQIESPEYNRAGLAWVTELLLNFPADFVTRYLGAVIKVLQLARTELLFGVYGTYVIELQSIAMAVPWMAGLVLALLATKSLRLAVFGLALLFFLCGYPILQFQLRHFFHLQLIPIWIGAFLFQRVIDAVRRVRAGLPLLPQEWLGGSPTARAATFALVTLGAIFAVLWSLRSWQQQHLVTFLRSYESAPSRVVPVLPGERGDEQFWNLGAVPRGAGARTPPPQTRLWAADFDASRCGLDELDLRLLYEADDPFYDATRVARLVIRPRARYVFPTYEIDGSGSSVFGHRLRFLGVSLPDESANCLVSLRELDDPRRFGLLPSLILRDGWESEVLFQTIGRTAPDPSARRVRRTIAVPTSLSLTRKEIDSIVSGGDNQDLRSAWFRDPSLTGLGEGFSFESRVPEPYSYLLRLPPRNISAGSFLVVHGNLLEGGITIGLIASETWITQLSVTDPGPFRAIFRVDPGTYEVALANNVPITRFNRLNIDRVAWYTP